MKFRTKFTAISLALMLLLGVTSMAAMAAEPFPDMPQDYSTAALQAAVDNGLLHGIDGKLMPGANLTRAQMAAIINRAFGAEKTADLAGYRDVPAGAWFAQDMAKAVYMKTFRGSGSTLAPNDNITRQQAFVVLARALSLPEGDLTALNGFSDRDQVSAYAAPSLAAMVTAGYVHGTDGKLNPNAFITRAQFAVVMNNIIKTYITKAGEYTELSEGSVLISVPNVTLKNVTVRGDLILGDGIGEGDVTLDSVTVTGRTIVRGGGTNSFVVKGDSKLGSVIVSKVDGNVRVAVEGRAQVQLVEIQDGKNDVLVEGKIETLTVAASDVPVVVQNAEIANLNVAASDAEVTVAKGSTVTTVTVEKANVSLSVAGTVTTVTTQAPATSITVSGTVATVNAEKAAEGAKIETAKGASVGTVNAAAAGTAISGEGTVTNANVTADNVKVDTSGTKTTVADGVAGTTSNGNDLAGGTTSTTTDTKPVETPPKDDEGGGGTTTTPTLTKADLGAMTFVLTTDQGTETFSLTSGIDISGLNGAAVITSGKMTSSSNLKLKYTVSSADYGKKSFTVGQDYTVTQFLNLFPNVSGVATVEHVSAYVRNFVAANPDPGFASGSGSSVTLHGSFSADGYKGTVPYDITLTVQQGI